MTIILLFGALFGIVSYYLMGGNKIERHQIDEEKLSDDKISNNSEDNKIENETNISDWKTYRNEEFGFKVEYPSKDLDLFFPAHGNFLISKKINSLDKYFLLSVFDNTNNLSINEYIENEIPKLRGPYSQPTVEVTKIESYINNNTNGKKVTIKFDTRDYINIQQRIILNKGNFLYIIFLPENISENLSESQLETANQILSTFKFIDKDKETFSCGDSIIKDIDGNIYNTVKIGEQCWMKENLKVTKNPEGEKITRYCYNNNESICETDGGLYDWNTAMDGSTDEGAQGICPDGWHVPRDSEWYVLISYLKDDEEVCDNSGAHDCASVKTKLLSGGLSGFDAIYTGLLSNNEFEKRGFKGYFWSSSDIWDQVSWKIKASEVKKNHAWARFLESSLPNIYVAGSFKKYSHSIRCLKD